MIELANATIPLDGMRATFPSVTFAAVKSSLQRIDEFERAVMQAAIEREGLEKWIDILESPLRDHEADRWCCDRLNSK